MLYLNYLGAHFGSTYLHLLFLTYPELSPSPSPHIYQPSIFGFRVSTLSKSGPRNQWLRKYPQEYTDDDENEDNNSTNQVIQIKKYSNITY